MSLDVGLVGAKERDVFWVPSWNVNWSNPKELVMDSPLIVWNITKSMKLGMENSTGLKRSISKFTTIFLVHETNLISLDSSHYHEIVYSMHAGQHNM